MTKQDLNLIDSLLLQLIKDLEETFNGESVSLFLKEIGLVSAILDKYRDN